MVILEGQNQGKYGEIAPLVALFFVVYLCLICIAYVYF
jgi:hypothetical protein